MKASKNVILRSIAGEHILVPMGETAKKFQGIMTLNGSGLLLWQTLQQPVTGEQLVTVITDRYEVDRATAARDVAAFLDKMRQAGILEEEDSRQTVSDHGEGGERS